MKMNSPRRMGDVAEQEDKRKQQGNTCRGRGNSGCVWMVEDGRRNVHKSWEPKKPIRERDSKSPEEDGGHGTRWINV